MPPIKTRGLDNKVSEAHMGWVWGLWHHRPSSHWDALRAHTTEK